MRLLSKLAVAILFVGALAHPLSAQVTYAPSGSAEASPPLVVTPPAAGPDQLVRKSVQDLVRGNVTGAVHDDVTALQRGPLLIHGNYCGLGNRPGTQPTDALDAACMRHDACTVDGKLPNCACDQRLYREAEAIAEDPLTPADLKVTAGATATAMSLLICK